MKKIFQKTLFVVGFLAISLIAVFIILDEPIPKGKHGEEAEILADKILEALNKQAWDSLESIGWVYPIGNHSYHWLKSKNDVIVKWDNYRVIINTKDHTGQAWKDGDLINDNNLIEKAFKYFNNDSFWLIAPYKIKDPGTIRMLVDYDGREALLVQYTSGGTTPGDSYLWILDDDYKPRAWKLWASIIPIGGMEFTWENWVNVDGAQISTLHKGLMDIEIKIERNQSSE